MPTRPDFGRILDEKLEVPAFAWASCEEAAPSARWRPGSSPVFLFGDLHNGFTAGPARPIRSSVSSGAPPWTAVYAARPGAQLRPARRLSPAQQQALDDLRSLGASALTAEFTDAGIKSAFRILARKFHPDTHPGSSEVERARLARAFASVCDAYRTLTTAVH